MDKNYVSLIFINIGKITPSTVPISSLGSFKITIMKKILKADILISMTFTSKGRLSFRKPTFPLDLATEN